MSIYEPGWLSIDQIYSGSLFNANLEKELTITHSDEYGSKEVKLYRYLEESGTLLVPRSRKGQFHGTGVTKIEKGRRIKDFPAFPLRTEQPEAVDAVVRQLREKGGAVLVAACGRGKTVMGIEAARRVRRSTLILVHKTFLLDQWAERIHRFLPEATVGEWRKGTVNSGDEYDFVIGMVQSILSPKRDYPRAQYDSFGLLIVDEVHRFSAPKWQRVIVRFPARYRLGLTATPNRRDGMERVFYEHIGAVGYSMRSRPTKPSVSRVNLGTRINARRYIQPWDGKANTSKLITMITENEYRNKAIVEIVIRAAKAGRVLLLLSDRRKHLDTLQTAIEREVPKDCLVRQFVGGMSKDDQDLGMSADVILATYKMADEALDIPSLDTLFLTTPRVNVIQPVGRILREEVPDKQSPTVVDFVDEKIPVLLSYWFARRKKYVAQGYLPP